MKIRCPYHEDRTPSYHIYPDGSYHCFSCGVHGHSPELKYESRPKHVEDLPKRLDYIRSLPTKEIRGVILPYDLVSYYVVWPDGSYYNQRFFQTGEGQPKYKHPAGHHKSLFVAKEGTGSTTLIVVEGELNALSITAANPAIDCVSPGSAGDFYAKSRSADLRYYSQYPSVRLIADKDKAGAIACIELKSKLLRHGVTDVKINLWENDANDILVNYGQTKLQEKINEALDLPEGVPGNQGAVPPLGGGTSKYGTGPG